MKKFLSVLLLIAVLISCCACGADKGADNSALDPASPEAMFGHIDQSVPIDGYHKIWNAEGVQFMLENGGDLKFEILCNIDMEGATLAPMQEFSGMIKGANFTISNFTVQGGDQENFGIICVNKGKVRNLLLDNVTLIPGPNAKNVGGLVGDNQGEIQRCTLVGTMNVEKAAASCGALAGINTGDMLNSVINVDINYTAPGKANVGGIAGTVTGGKVELVETGGRLDVTDCAQKSVGLFAGDVQNVVMNSCAFIGASNTQDGKLFTNFTGNADDDELAVAAGALWRDNYKEPLTEGQNKLRDLVVAEMEKMGTVQWKLKEDLRHGCVCSLNICHGVYNTSYTYYGIPYNHKGGSLERFNYIIDEDGYVKDWAYGMDQYDGFDMYIGNDCSTAVAHAWWRVSNSTDFLRCTYQIPQKVDFPNVAPHLENSGAILVGELNTDFSLPSNNWTISYLEHNTEQEMMEAYACMRKGDAYTYIVEAGGHTRMAAEDAVVVRDQQGNIDPNYSYVISDEQGSTTMDEVNMTYSSWKIRFKYTFASLLGVGAVPNTCEELLTGEMEPAECTILDDADGYAGLYTGTVKANYFLDSVDMVIKDSKGNVVMDHTMWTTVDKRNDRHNDGIIRNYVDSYDLVSFAMPLSKIQLEKGETYTYSITGNLRTYDSFVVKEASFIYGQVN